MAALRLPDKTYRMIQELAGSGSKQEVVAEAVEILRRRRMLERANHAYAALRQDPAAWAEEQAERTLWDNTLADGMESD